ncbi:MAG: deoxyribodipyrimidine photolyase, partial [Bacteroidetes bacterium]
MCPVNLVWFKRDLRLSDHVPLTTAIQQGLPTLLLYCFEPSLIASPDADLRHWRFIHEYYT